jgi:hypothetical protein
MKTWVFTLPHGTLRITLQLYPDGTSGLGTHPGRHGNEAPIVEQAEPLRQVLSEMPELGADPHKLVYLGKMIFGYGQDVTENSRMHVQIPRNVALAYTARKRRR